MAGNTFGTLFRLTSFGESHGAALGGVIDGCKPGIEMPFDAIAAQLARRRPGQSSISTQRNESDYPEWLSGIFEGKTTGAPIAFIVRNTNQQSGDYETLKNVYRPSHADYTYEQKYGIRDYRGSGRASARETVARVVAGTLAEEILKRDGIEICAYVSAVAQHELPFANQHYSRSEVDVNVVRCPDETLAAKMIAEIEQARSEGDSLGGIITCRIDGVPAGLGEPVFDKLHAELGKAMLSINAVKGFSIGSGFDSARMKGSEHNDAFILKEGKPGTSTNHSGGIQGGISNGEPIWFRVAFKPVASIARVQETVTQTGEMTELSVKGRHDPCVVPRAVPIVESMAALVLVDHLMRQQAIK
jgi:chorismate synthase